MGPHDWNSGQVGSLTEARFAFAGVSIRALSRKSRGVICAFCAAEHGRLTACSFGLVRATRGPRGRNGLSLARAVRQVYATTKRTSERTGLALDAARLDN